MSVPQAALAIAVLALIAVLSVPVHAAKWPDLISEYDQERIDRIDDAIEQGNAEAEGQGTAYEQAVKEGLMGAPAGPVDSTILAGGWRCRTIKVGGPFAGLVVYDWFKCRLYENDIGLVAEKLTGSQRFKGQLYRMAEDKLLLLAGGYYHYEDPRPYGAADSADGKSPDNRDKVAIVEALGPDWLRFTFPFPARESTYDIVEFRRAN